MFRINHIIITRSLLNRRPVDIQLPSLSSTPSRNSTKKSTEREKCPPPPPPSKPPRRDDKLLWGTMALIVSAGAFAVYAKSDPEIRDWLTINAPWFDDMIAIAYQENMTYGEFARNSLGDLKKNIVCYFKDPPKPFKNKSGTPLHLNNADDKHKTPCGEDKDEEKAKQELVEQEKEKTKAPVPTMNIGELETCMDELGKTALENYTKARDASIQYNKLVEKKISNFTVSVFKTLHKAMDERIAVVKQALETGDKAKIELDDLSRYFECGIRGATKEMVDIAKCNLKAYQNKTNAVYIQYQWENDQSKALDEQWHKVEVLVMKYVEEMQIMYLGLDYTAKKPQIGDNDPDILLYHTMRYVEQLKVDLEEAVAAVTERVNRGVDTLSQKEEDVKNRDAKIDSLSKSKKAGMGKFYIKRLEDQKAHNDKVLKKSLKSQADKSERTLEARLAEKENEANEKLNKMVADTVVAEKKIMKKELNEMSKKLKQLENKLEARLKAERETRRSQELWSAGSSLLAATKKGTPWVCVNKELKAIEKASGGSTDKLVVTVLKAIPDSVRVNGVVPESVLKERYRTMEDTAMKVALVEEEGAPLPFYFLSWLQSLLLFMKVSGIPQDEIDKPPKEINPVEMGLDTFDLLQRARFWMERGNVANALTYVNALSGASRGAAAEWRNAARAHLETRQAAEAVIAHATALGLQYI